MKLLAYRKFAIRVPKMQESTCKQGRLMEQKPGLCHASVYFRAVQFQPNVQPRFYATCIHSVLSANVYAVSDRGICEASVRRIRIRGWILLYCHVTTATITIVGEWCADNRQNHHRLWSDAALWDHNENVVKWAAQAFDAWHNTMKFIVMLFQVR